MERRVRSASSFFDIAGPRADVAAVVGCPVLNARRAHPTLALLEARRVIRLRALVRACHCGNPATTLRCRATLRSRTLVAFLALCGIAALFGCSEDRACSRDLVRPDGGFYRCLVSEDCPRETSDVLVCLNNRTPDKYCVRCTEDARCIEVSPYFCH